MKKKFKYPWIACLALAPGLFGHSIAWADGSGVQQEELKQALEMMKQQGMDPQQLQQMEGFMQNMVQMEAQKKNAALAKQQHAFEADTAGFGSATVEVEGNRYDLKITRCEVKDSKQGIFNIQARQAPGLEEGELSIHSDGEGRQQSVRFSINTRPPTSYRADSPGLKLDGKVLSWQGQVEVVPDNRKLQFTLNLSCGAEAVFYDTATRERPDKAPNVVTLYLGPETYEFEAGRCSTKPYRTGNWEVVSPPPPPPGPPGFSPPAGRDKAGRPQLTAAWRNILQQRQLSPLELKKQLAARVGAYRNKQLADHEKKYGKAYWDKVPPAEIAAAMEVSGAEMDKIMAKAHAMEFPSASDNQGVTTINGQDVVFRGPAMRTSDADRAPVFRDLSATPEIFLRCDG